jgi:hypothetical protein
MNLKHRLVSTALIGSLSLAPLAGCSSLPGNNKQQGTAIGAGGGAIAGAAIAKNNRLLGALIGGALGAGGGYLIGAQKNKIDDKNREDAVRASKRGESDPAKPEDVERSRTADLNEDGFVTLDEVVAMERARLSDREMIDRLERTQQVFELTDTQETHLRDRGVSREVVLAMRDMNQDYARTASGRDGDARYDDDARSAGSRTSDDRTLDRTSTRDRDFDRSTSDAAADRARDADRFERVGGTSRDRY